MSSTLTAEKVVQQGNSLKLNLIFDDQNRKTGPVNYYTNIKDPDPAVTLISQEYLINCLVAFQAKVIRYEDNVLYFVRCVPKRDINHLKYTVNYSHKFTDSKSKIYHCCIENDQWQLISEVILVAKVCKFFISVNLSISTWMNPFMRIYNDTELVGFEFRGEDGSVWFHKAVAGGFSPDIKTGLIVTGEWGEDGKSLIDAPPGTTRQTLQHLKDYMYLDKIPETG